MIQSALRAVWAEPSVEPPPGRPWWDVALVAVLVPVTVIEGVARTDVPLPPLSIALALVCVASVLWRRSHPLPATVVAFAAQTAAGVIPELAGHDEAVLGTTACVLLLPYSLGRWAAGRDAVLGVAFVLACHVLREPFYGNPWGENIVGAGFLLFPAALGAAVRSGVTARSRAVDQSRLRERELLARELHDTVAHHVSGIVIQAQAGRVVAATDPARAVEVLEVIEQAATRSLSEMRSIVGLLRDGAAAERAPVPTVADLSGLADATSGPPEVVIDLEGPLGDLPAAVDAAAYRIVQESITNARRHARGAARVRAHVACDATGVRIQVEDDGAAVTGARGEGFGLTGMGERAELLGGTFRAGPGPGRGWIVAADLPTSGEPT